MSDEPKPLSEEEIEALWSESRMEDRDRLLATIAKKDAEIEALRDDLERIKGLRDIDHREYAALRERVEELETAQRHR